MCLWGCFQKELRKEDPPWLWAHNLIAGAQVIKGTGTHSLWFLAIMICTAPAICFYLHYVQPCQMLNKWQGQGTMDSDFRNYEPKQVFLFTFLNIKIFETGFLFIWCKLTYNSLSAGWTWMHHPPALISPLLGLKKCTTTPSFYIAYVRQLVNDKGYLFY